MIANIGICMTTFIKDPDIIWRGCVVLWKVALFSPEICREVGLLQIHETLAIEYDTYKADPRVQQQVLWLFNSLLTYPKGRRIVHESEVSMALFKRLLAQRDLDVGNLKNVARADQLKPFEVVIPHQIRAFLRETRGLILGQRAPEEDEAAAKLQSDAMAAKAKGRKNFDPVPRYSTVEEEFKDGIPGLVDERKLTKKEQEEQAIKAEEAGSVNDWGLTYGKKKTGAKIAPTSTSTQMVPLSKKTNKT